jgi:Fe-S cluster assembly protein SufD
VPTEADEDWRYGRIDDLDLGVYEPVVGPGGDPPDLAGGPADLLSGLGAPAALVRTRDGFVVSSALGAPAGSTGLSVTSARTLAAPPACFGSVVAPSRDAFTVLAEAFGADAVFVTVRAGVHVAGPIVIVHELDRRPGPAAVFPRTFVELGEGAVASVVEHLVSATGEALVCPVTELEVGRDARLAYHSIQELDRSAWQLGYVASRVDRGGSLQSFAASFGGDYARLCTHSSLVGEAATSELLAAYFGDGTQVQDMRTFQEHAAPRTRSVLIFKGAVDDAARSVYSGLIHIHKGARKSDAGQTNRNLVLSESAHADSVPNLDIEENDVRCSHASAVGPIDRAQRFYVESRGVPPSVAERLILLGFFDDLLARAPEPGVAAYLRGVVARRLVQSERATAREVGAR